MSAEKRIVPPTYIENEERRRNHKAPRLSDEVFSLAKDRFINVCLDIALVNRERKTFYLAKRTNRPAQDLWWVIGGSRAAGSLRDEAIAGVLKRELDFSDEESQTLLSNGKIEWAAALEGIWENRAQEPIDHIEHVKVDVYSYEPSPEELSAFAGRLTDKEFHLEDGIKEFTRADLEALAEEDEKLHPGFSSGYRFLIQYWDAIFIQSAEKVSDTESPLGVEMSHAFVDVSTTQ